jgi:hypothetical protein
MKQLLIVYAMLPGCASAQQMIIVPRGQRVVMVDGKLGPGEWDDGASLPLADKARLYVKQSGGYVAGGGVSCRGQFYCSMFT